MLNTMRDRETWIDSVKGVTIIMVVFHHVFSGIKTSIGFSDLITDIYDLTSPIRMPLFFLVAGFFARKSIHGELNKFINSKVIHFAYFYILWSAISIFTRASLSRFTNNDVFYSDFLTILWHPTFTLWFLYSLLIAFVLARLMRNLPVAFQLGLALVAAVYVIHTIPSGEFILVKRTLRLLPFFLFGVYYSESIRTWVCKTNFWRPVILGSGFLLLASIAHAYGSPDDAAYFFPMAGLAIATVMCIIFKMRNTIIASGLSFVGERSLYIYLMHFLPAAGFRVVLLKLGVDIHPLSLAIVCTIASVFGCILMYEILKNLFPFKYLFERPSAFFLRK
ncbi:MAG: acyltransferase family protein [Paraglaciecola sp.]